jgi:hypothetical protein
MVYTNKDNIKKRFCQVGVLAGIIAAPFTGGLSLSVTLLSALSGKKYNSFLQSDEERLDEAIYYKKRELMRSYESMKNEEISISNRFKSLEDRIKGGRIIVEND